MRLLNFLKIGCTMLVLLSLIGCAYNSNSTFPSNEEAQKARIEQLLNKNMGTPLLYTRYQPNMYNRRLILFTTLQQ